MSAISGVKFETYLRPDELCSGCLSSDRILRKPCEFLEILQKITGNMIQDHKNVLLCWECRAVLRKADEFRKNVAIAQELISCVSFYSSKKINPLATLSKLSVNTKLPLKIIDQSKEEVDFIDNLINVINKNGKSDIGDTQIKLEHKVEFEHEIDEDNEINNSCNDDNSNQYDMFDSSIRSDAQTMKINDEYETKITEIEVKQNIDVASNNKSDVGEQVYKDVAIKTDVIEIEIENINDNKLLTMEDKQEVDDNVESNDDDKDDDDKDDDDFTCYYSKRIKYKPKNKVLAKNSYKRMLYNKGRFDSMRKKIDHTEINDWLEKDKKLFKKHFARALYKCHQCFIGFNKEVSFDKHNTVHRKTKTKTHRCELCESYFSSVEELATHITDIHQCVYECDLCDFACHSKWIMKCHLKMKHEKLFKCLECPGMFSKYALFKEHFKDHHSIFICNEDNCLFKSKKSIVKHMERRHTVHRCEPCNRTFKNYNAKSGHMARMHTYNPSESTYCVTCNLQLDNVDKYKQHIRTNKAHDKEFNREKVKCPKCPRDFTSKAGLKRHFDFVHLKVFRFRCDACDVQFIRKQTLTEHILSKHQRVPKPKTKVCPYCARAFHRNRTLAHHIRTHTGERPHACYFCNATFAQKSAMNTHVKKIHLEEKQNA